MMVLILGTIFNFCLAKASFVYRFHCLPSPVLAAHPVTHRPGREKFFLGYTITCSRV